MIEAVNSTGFGLINALIGILNLGILVYLLRRKHSITREETTHYIIFRDKDGYIINTLKK